MEQLYLDKTELLEAVQQEIAEAQEKKPTLRDHLRDLLGLNSQDKTQRRIAKAMLLLLLAANLVAVVLLILFLAMLLRHL